MPSFKKNRPVSSITEIGKDIISKAEDGNNYKKAKKPVKEITIPFDMEMSNLLEKMFLYFEGDISRRKLCAKCLLKVLREEAGRLNLNRTSLN